ncbi:hypothetical protein CEXT_180951 [Caerostris extrusa]|uniref:Uncharacterized protein n=1 Tax=Caerostris extrusa TaxID=172846 RepID=A0AAV4XC81_CAEEX|nr:hypothetical protein CEXT_180951 [Caerostris extrusa]
MLSSSVVFFDYYFDDDAPRSECSVSESSQVAQFWPSSKTTKKRFSAVMTVGKDFVLVILCPRRLESSGWALRCLFSVSMSENQDFAPGSPPYLVLGFCPGRLEASGWALRCLFSVSDVRKSGFCSGQSAFIWYCWQSSGHHPKRFSGVMTVGNDFCFSGFCPGRLESSGWALRCLFSVSDVKKSGFCSGQSAFIWYCR